MMYRKLDPNGDYTMGDRKAFFVNSPEAVAQAITTRLKLFVGEWFIDTSDGTPWATEVLTKRFLGSTPDAVIKQRILDTQGVTEIVEYASNFDGNTRRLSIQATVNTTYGQATISGSF